MGSSDRLFNRERTVHELLGGGFAADVILWRQKNVTVGILLMTLSSWVVFEISGYTLLSLVSSVLLLLFIILFLWAKSAAILNRPPPPLPELYLSEEMVNEAGTWIRAHVNDLLSVSQDVALGKDTKLFFRVAAFLLLISVVGGLADFRTLTYSSLVVVLTVPAFYERYEEYIERYMKLIYTTLRQIYAKFDECINRVRKWILEKQKLS